MFIYFPPFQLFTVVADTTDFLVDNLMDYFQGGLMDMAAWTNRKWHDAITMIENGTRQVGKRRHIQSNATSCEIYNEKKPIIISAR